MQYWKVHNSNVAVSAINAYKFDRRRCRNGWDISSALAQNKETNLLYHSSMYSMEMYIWMCGKSYLVEDFVNKWNCKKIRNSEIHLMTRRADRWLSAVSGGKDLLSRININQLQNIDITCHTYIKDWTSAWYFLSRTVLHFSTSAYLSISRCNGPHTHTYTLLSVCFTFWLLFVLCFKIQAPSTLYSSVPITCKVYFNYMQL